MYGGPLYSRVKFFEAVMADQGGDMDIAKLHDTALDDLWLAACLGDQTWSRMSSPERQLYEVWGFDQVKGYGVNGGRNALMKSILPNQVDFVIEYGDWDLI